MTLQICFTLMLGNDYKNGFKTSNPLFFVDMMTRIVFSFSNLHHGSKEEKKDFQKTVSLI